VEAHGRGSLALPPSGGISLRPYNPESKARRRDVREPRPNGRIGYPKRKRNLPDIVRRWIGSSRERTGLQ
jgi:hypothetical protein